MFTLILGLALFIGAHTLREIGLRTSIQQTFGKKTYLFIIASLVLMGIALMVMGKSQAPFIQMWAPPFHWRVYSSLLMFSACVFFILGFLPLSYSKQQLKHPALIAVIIWGVSHLMANGDLASLLLFGGLCLWALIKIISLALTQKMSHTTVAPALHWDVAALIFGFIAYSLLLTLHGQLFGFALIDT